MGSSGKQWEAKIVVIEGKGVSIQRQEEEPGRPAVDDQQDLVEFVSADNSEGKEAIEALPAAQPKNPEIDEHCFRLRGVEPGSSLDNRQRQFSTKSDGVNFQTGRILG